MTAAIVARDVEGHYVVAVFENDTPQGCFEHMMKRHSWMRHSYMLFLRTGPYNKSVYMRLSSAIKQGLIKP